MWSYEVSDGILKMITNQFSDSLYIRLKKITKSKNRNNFLFSTAVINEYLLHTRSARKKQFYFEPSNKLKSDFRFNFI